VNDGRIGIMNNTFAITSNSFKDRAVIKNIYALNRSLENIDAETPWTRIKFESLFKSDILNVAGITGIYSNP
tara:strand:- start:77 stop:292 length:216 start_codon:yes stop_codon:yes gene_type:complete